MTRLGGPMTWVAHVALIAILTMTGPDSLLMLTLGSLMARTLWVSLIAATSDTLSATVTVSCTSPNTAPPSTTCPRPPTSPRGATPCTSPTSDAASSRSTPT